MTGKEIISTWARECLSARLTIDLSSEAYAGVTAGEWANLVDRIDVVLREAKQNGVDQKKQHKLLTDNSEHGPFWQQFYLRGLLSLPGVAEAFECKKDEPIWLNQWSEVLRVSFRKPSLRALDPGDFMFSIKSGMSGSDWENLNKYYLQILADLSRDVVQEEKESWSPAKLKGVQC